MIHTIGNKFNKTVQQFIGFGMVGITNTVISLLTYYILIGVGFDYLLAYGLGFLISTVNSFYWNNKYVFQDRKEVSAGKAFLKSLLSYGISFLLSIGLVVILVEYLHVSKILAPVLKIVLVLPVNFVLNKHWAFRG